MSFKTQRSDNFIKYEITIFVKPILIPPEPEIDIAKMSHLAVMIDRVFNSYNLLWFTHFLVLNGPMKLNVTEAKMTKIIFSFFHFKINPMVLNKV